MAIMATEEPQPIQLDQKVANIAPDEDKMAVDEPASQAVNGHEKSDEVMPDSEVAPKVNGSAESLKSPAEAEKDVQNKQAFAANSSLPEQEIPKPESEQAPAEDRELTEVNGTAEKVLSPSEAAKEDAKEPAKASAVNAESRYANDAVKPETETAPAAEDAMDVDVSTDQTNVASSDEHAKSTQETFPVGDSAIVSSPTNLTQSADLSKLDIKGSQEEMAPPKAEASVSELPPASPTKMSREREEDPAAEPAAKRAKTESQADTAEDTIGVATGSSTANSSATNGSVDTALNDKPITPFQNKELRAKIANIKKTKAGGNFRQSVEKLWPLLWDSYKSAIDKPVDLSLFEAKLRDGKYANYGEFKADVQQLHANALKFNGTPHVVTSAAEEVMNKLFREELPRISSLEEPVKPDKKTQAIRHAEPRTANPPRRQSQSQPRAPAASPKSRPKQETAAATAPVPPMAASATAPAFALPPNGVPQIRRDSTRDDGDRPKRPIHPPKNRDLEYSSKANRKKKLEPETKFFKEVLGELHKAKYWAICHWFQQPVDPVAMNIPTYFSVIKKPMDLSVMNEKLENGEYRNAKDFEKDMRQIVANSELFNGPEAEVTKCGRELEKAFKEKMAEKDNWMLRNYPQKVASAAASPEPSVHESEDESEVEPEEEDNEQIRNLVHRVSEEQDKLSTLLGAKKPDLMMIDIQQNIVNMLQRKLVEERTKFNETKKPKQKKKSTKNKPKSSANASSSGHNTKRPTANAVATKKAVPSNKKAMTKKRHIGQLEKAVIADGINELDGPMLNKAVEIIKRDTDQKEDDDGQLELDIELLSQDALNRLYDLIMKTNPTIYNVVAARPEFSSKPEEPEQPKPKSSSTAPKPKKNKPMNKHEQERNIEKLRELKAKFQRQGSGSQEPLSNDVEENHVGDSSEEESDSEEE